jgi:hypothetical protein
MVSVWSIALREWSDPGALAETWAAGKTVRSLQCLASTGALFEAGYREALRPPSLFTRNILNDPKLCSTAQVAIRHQTARS